MKRIKLAVLLIALIATSFQSLHAVTVACSDKDLSMISDMAPNCQYPVLPTVIAQHCGITTSQAQVCLRELAGMGEVVRLPDGTYCRQTG